MYTCKFKDVAEGHSFYLNDCSGTGKPSGSCILNFLFLGKSSIEEVIIAWENHQTVCPSHFVCFLCSASLCPDSTCMLPQYCLIESICPKVVTTEAVSVMPLRRPQSFVDALCMLALIMIVSPGQYVHYPLDVASGIPAPRAAAPCLQRHLALVELGPRQQAVVNN